MFMARRNLGDARLGIRTMLSAEPWTVPGCGSLSFLAVGEVCEDDTIHDRQQPHDLFMELAVDYSRALTTNWRWQVYAGLAGEPALGPPGYPHRASANTNPIAPITHHWLEATRVTFGVVTMGVHNRRWRLSGRCSTVAIRMTVASIWTSARSIPFRLAFLSRPASVWRCRCQQRA
jgi:hypothetical protein